MCGGNDLWVTLDNGIGHCYECTFSCRVGDENEGPKKYQQKEKKILDVPSIRKVYKEVSEFYRGSLLPQHRLYLANRGIDEKSVEQFEIGFCPHSLIPIYETRAAKEAGLFRMDKIPSLAGRIVFPYRADGEITDMRGRAVGDEEPKYKSPIHQSYVRGAIYPYNYDFAIALARQKKYLLITEGEIKALVAQIHGFPTVAFPGMTAWRPGLIFESNIQPIVVFDNSPSIEDKIRVDKSIAKLYTYLPTLNVATLPLQGENKMDIDSFLLHPRGGSKLFTHLVEHSLPYEKYRILRRG